MTARNKVSDVISCLEKRAVDAADCPRQHEDDERIEHYLHSLLGFFHEYAEGHDTTRDVQQKGDENRSEGGVEQSCGRVGVGEDLLNGFVSAEAVAQIENVQNGRHEEGHHRNDQIVRVTRVLRVAGHQLFLDGGGRALGLLFVFLHAAHFDPGEVEEEKPQKAADGVGVQNERARVDGEGFLNPAVLDLRNHNGGPAGDGE